jgi:hypothetical protein
MASECVSCDTTSNGQSCVFSSEGFGKWGKGSMYCRKCFNELKSDIPLLAFKCYGRNLYYDWSWIFRWKNPHGNHTIFTDREIDELGGSYPEYDWEPSDQQRAFIQEKVQRYLSSLPAPPTRESPGKRKGVKGEGEEGPGKDGSAKVAKHSSLTDSEDTKSAPKRSSKTKK